MANCTVTRQVALLIIILAAAPATMGEALGQAGAMPEPANRRQGPVGSAPAQGGVSAKSSITPMVAVGNPLWSIPLAKLDATRERPILLPSRRPPARAAARVQVTTPAIAVGTVAAPELPSLQLLGSLYGENEGVAVFMDEKTKGLVRLKAGEGYAGWLLSGINGREVVLEKDNRRLKLALPSPMPGAEK